MSTKHRPPQPKPASQVFALPPAVFPDKEQLLEKLPKNQEAVLSALRQRGGEVRYAVPENVTKAIAAIATNAWKAKMKMLDTASGEVRDEMKRVYRRTFWSPPAQKALSPAPVTTMHRRSPGVKRSGTNISRSSSPIRVLSALRRSGRFKVTTRTPDAGVVSSKVSKSVRIGGINPP